MAQAIRRFTLEGPALVRPCRMCRRQKERVRNGLTEGNRTIREGLGGRSSSWHEIAHEAVTSNVELFQDLSKSQLKRLASAATEVSHPPGKAVATEGRGAIG